MIRLAVPIIIILLMLFGVGAWLLVPYFQTETAEGPPTEQKPAVSEQKTSPSSNEPARAEAPATGDSQASFDVARIDPQGTSVFAGRAEPGSTVTIMGDGEAIGTAEADENGEWTFATEHPFASPDPKLALSVKSAAETKAAKQKVAEAKVAGSLQSAEPAKEKPERKSANTIASNLLKDFEGIVAAARTEAEQEKKRATQGNAETKAKAETGSEAGAQEPEEKPPAKVEESTPPATTAQKQEKKVALAEPSQQAAPTPAATPSAPETTPAPSQQSASPPSPPSAAPPARVAATTPETPPLPRKSIPVPITFVFNEATFTNDGRKAVALLLEYLQLKHFPRVSMTGHADERGTQEFNMDLSRERLDAVAAYLKKGGYKGELNLIPKGETEPFTGVDRSQYSQEELYQLDRRVELITTP